MVFDTFFNLSMMSDKIEQCGLILKTAPMGASELLTFILVEALFLKAISSTQFNLAGLEIVYLIKLAHFLTPAFELLLYSGV